MTSRQDKNNLRSLTRKASAKLMHFEENHPFEILGPRIVDEGESLLINALLPFAKEASVILKGTGKKLKMEKVIKEGLFQIRIPGIRVIPRYKIHWLGEDEVKVLSDDPYAFRPLLGDVDVHLLGEGNHFKSYEVLGAQLTAIDKVKGVNFILWAPNAKAVSIASEFNKWTAGAHPMTQMGNSGYWGLFIPGLNEGTLYKFAVKSKSNAVTFRSDPYAFSSELRPGNASIVTKLKGYKWKDSAWIRERKKLAKPKSSVGRKPVSIYEVHLGSCMKDYSKNEWGYLNYRELAHRLVDYAVKMNYTHLELLPVMEHPLDISWGYQVVNYFAPTSRYGTPEDFMYFVDYCHINGIGVILDWVPSHFPTDVHGLGEFDGKRIYEYANLRKGFHKDWGTYVFDYERNEVSNFLISNALFWIEKYHIDGLRVDAVASMLYLDYSRNDGEWEPNIYGSNENIEAVAFLRKLNDTVHSKHKGTLMIAEESSSWPGVTMPAHLGGLGFDMKWNMGWMHDILAYFSMDPVFRKFHHGKLTFAIWYAFNEKFVLPLSHDEVVHLKKSIVEKMPGDTWHKFANLRLLYGFMYGHPGKKLNFMCNDIAQYREWNSEAQMDWDVLDYEFNAKFHDYFRELNSLYCTEPALHEDDFDSSGFRWVDYSNSDESVISFLRFNLDKSRMLLFTFNMTPVIRKDYQLGVPFSGFYKEILNSDAERFGGSNEGNLGGVWSFDQQRFDFPYSVKVILPPLAVNVYSYEMRSEEEIAEIGSKADAESSVDGETIETTENAVEQAEEKTEDVAKAKNKDVTKENTEEVVQELSEEDEMSGKISQILKKIRKK